MGELRSFRVPFAAAESEFTEKRSRFIGHIWPVETEEQAQAHIRAMKKRYYDARHNCWCYLVGESVVRYSDDGEPQGTAGQPMLNVFQRENVTNVCCVVTRYFGGILLGAGGLTRAYSKGARDALAAAGVDVDLCGHTHDGQMFPGNPTVRLFWENACGCLRVGSMHSIVTSGVGLFGPNMRVATRAEICPVTIHFMN